MRLASQSHEGTSGRRDGHGRQRHVPTDRRPDGFAPGYHVVPDTGPVVIVGPCGEAAHASRNSLKREVMTPHANIGPNTYLGGHFSSDNQLTYSRLINYILYQIFGLKKFNP